MIHLYRVWLYKCIVDSVCTQRQCPWRPETLVPLGAGVPEACEHPGWLLWPERRSSAMAGRTSNLQAVSPDPNSPLLSLVFRFVYSPRRDKYFQW